MHLFRDGGTPDRPAVGCCVGHPDPRGRPHDGDLAWRSSPTPGSRTRSVDGVLVATRHPTGWFLHAVRRDDLSEDQLAPFRELVTVRSYLSARARSGGAGVACLRRSRASGARCGTRSARELAELDDALVD